MTGIHGSVAAESPAYRRGRAIYNGAEFPERAVTCRLQLLQQSTFHLGTLWRRFWSTFRHHMLVL